MKTLLLFITLAVLMTACSSNPTIGDGRSSFKTVVDTTGLADFQAWKKLDDQQSGRSHEYTKTRHRNTSSRKNNNITKRESATTQTAYPAKGPRRKSWSKAAKGAAIGGASGAVAGAIINKKNRVVGGVVGGVVGAGVGYGIGRSMDKKDSRF